MASDLPAIAESAARLLRLAADDLGHDSPLAQDCLRHAAALERALAVARRIDAQAAARALRLRPERGPRR